VLSVVSLVKEIKVEMMEVMMKVKKVMNPKENPALKLILPRARVITNMNVTTKKLLA